jgi:hypothetical protein
VDLSQYEEALRELGCADAADLAEVEEAELLELGMKRIEVKRLLRHVQTDASRETAPNDGPLPPGWLEDVGADGTATYFNKYTKSKTTVRPVDD